LNPNAIRVISRILVLVDSIKPLDRLCLIAARILAPVSDDALLQLHERGDTASAGPADPFLQGLDGVVVGHREDHPESFFEQVGPMKSRVGGGDPGELDLLVLAEVR